MIGSAWYKIIMKSQLDSFKSIEIEQLTPSIELDKPTLFID